MDSDLERRIRGMSSVEKTLFLQNAGIRVREIRNIVNAGSMNPADMRHLLDEFDDLFEARNKIRNGEI